MVQPINYAIDIPDPSQAFLQAFKTGTAVTETRLAQEQAQRQAEQQRTVMQAFERLRQPGATAKDYADLSMLLPETQAKAVRESFNMLNADQQQAARAQAGQVFSAFRSGRPEIAIGLIQRQIDAKRNSGDESGAQFLETWRDVAKETPTATEDYFGGILAEMPGGKDVLEAALKVSAERRTAAEAPAKLLEAQSKAKEAEAKARVAVETATDDISRATALREFEQAKARKERADADVAEVDAEFARAKAVLGVKQQAATLRKTDADILIAQENNRIAALNAAQAKETNVLRRQELQQKIDDATKTRDAADRDQKATLANQSADIDNFLNTAQRVLNTPQNVIKSATGPVASRVITLSAAVADFEALVEALGSQAFIAQIPKIKGTGSLSEKEGDKLQASLQTLSLKQSPERLEENVTEAVRLLEKVRGNIALKYGVQAPPSDVPARELNVTVGGVTYSFLTKAAADAFKNSDAYRRAAGIR